jgi:NADH:ubiquinone oxidoreductase subunit 6 (subunit J)
MLFILKHLDRIVELTIGAFEELASLIFSFFSYLWSYWCFWFALFVKSFTSVEDIYNFFKYCYFGFFRLCFFLFERATELFEAFCRFLNNLFNDPLVESFYWWLFFYNKPDDIGMYVAQWAVQLFEQIFIFVVGVDFLTSLFVLYVVKFLGCIIFSVVNTFVAIATHVANCIVTLTFFNLIEIMSLFAAFISVSVQNPIHSVLLLAFVFFNISIVFLFLNAEFLAFVLIVVYVGAIAVLFLFVVMLFDIRLSTSTSFFKSTSKSPPPKRVYKPFTRFFLDKIHNFFVRCNLIGLIVVVFLFLFFRLFLILFSTDYSYPYFFFDANFFRKTMEISDLTLFGIALFNYYYIYVILVSLILFVVLVGCVVLITNDDKNFKK